MDLAVFCALVLIAPWWWQVERRREFRDHEIHRWPGRLGASR